MYQSLFFLILGGFLLYLSGELLIRGSSLLAKKYKLSSFFVGATVVAFGTSAPEFFVSLISRFKGFDDISLGNILGSNIANMAFVLGISLLLSKTYAKNKSANNFSVPKIELLLILLTPVIFLLGLVIGTFSIYFAIPMLLSFILFILLGFKNSTNTSNQEYTETKSIWLILLFIVLGTVGLPFAANLFVDGAKGIALSLGISELMIGVTITAFGTSLPELVASLVAIQKEDAQMSIGNVLGSNIINFYGILGIVSVLGVKVNPSSILELGILSVLTIILTLLPKLGKRATGTLMLLTYTVYLLAVMYRN